MTVNAIEKFVSKPYLVKKIVHAPIKELSCNLSVPKKAVNYSFVSGSGKKGDFDVYSFFDKRGVLLKRVSTYLMNGAETKFVTKFIAKDEARTVKFVNGKIESFTKLEKRWHDRTKLLWTKNVLSKKSNSDVQKIIWLEKHAKPQIIEWQTNWDGSAPELKYHNMNEIDFTAKEKAYLPPLAAPKSFRRFKQLSQMQLKEQGINSVYDEFYVITPHQACKISPEISDYFAELGGVGGFFDEKTGKIYVVLNKNLSVADEAGLIAHEIQHAKDYSDIARLEDTLKNAENSNYYDKSRKLGIIDKCSQPDEYERLADLRKTISQEDYYYECMKGNHDDLKIEGYAMDKENLESNICSAVWRKIMMTFGFWG